MVSNFYASKGASVHTSKRVVACLLCALRPAVGGGGGEHGLRFGKKHNSIGNHRLEAGGGALS
jgi:hypothetical protein